MIPDQKVKTLWANSTKQYYIEKGYNYTGINREFKVDLKDLMKGSKVNVYFICDFCNGKNQIEDNDKMKEYKILITQRKLLNKDCCNNKECITNKKYEIRIIKAKEKGNLLTDKFPEIAKQWDYNKNTKKPNEYLHSSNKKVFWICDQGHSYEATVTNRTLLKRGCPYCTNKKVSSDNCLAFTNKDLSKEWHPFKNKSLTPYDVVMGSNEKVWWVCDKGHEWKASIINRSNGRKCPYCQHRKVCEENSLKTVNPLLAEEWNYELNEKLPSDYLPFSNQKVWWICKECDHEWEAIISSRNVGNGCPVCCESKGEIKIRCFLEKIKNILFVSQYEFYDLKSDLGVNLKFDFCIFDEHKSLMFLIEYDGEQHYEHISSWISKEKFERLQVHDQMKNNYCKSNGISLLRIPYWDFDKIEKILENKLVECKII